MVRTSCGPGGTQGTHTTGWEIKSVLSWFQEFVSIFYSAYLNAQAIPTIAVCVCVWENDEPESKEGHQTDGYHVQ